MLFAVALAASTVFSAPAAMALTLTFSNLDAAGEGFNDEGFATPLPGNDATTLGGQRVNAFLHALELWSVHLRDGGVEIVVEASFDALGGNANSATLGLAQPASVNAGFTGAPEADTWYVVAQANTLSGFDLNGEGAPEVIAQFNSSVDLDSVLGTVDFYYGLDGMPGSDFDFVTVALHELLNGLGFIDLLGSDGAKFGGKDDAYLLHLRDDNFVPVRLSQMSDGQRASAIRDGPFLLWDGPGVVGESAALSAGVAGDGSVEIYAPAAFSEGSSTAHFNTSLSPDQIMEPFAGGVRRDLGLSLALLGDLGWALVPCGDASGDGDVKATDALAALQAAVGSGACAPAICDVDGNGEILSSDALRILRFAVGSETMLNCTFPT